MPPAARIGDMHTCPMVTGVVPHVGGPIIKGEPTVMIGFMPAARIGDQLTCVGPPDVIIKGSATVLISYMPAARLGDSTAHGGVIVVGHPTTMIGDAGSGGGGGGGGGGGAGGSAGGPATPASTPGVTSAATGASGTITPVNVVAVSVETKACVGECTNPACNPAFKEAGENGTPLVDRESPGCNEEPEPPPPCSNPECVSSFESAANEGTGLIQRGEGC